MEDRKKKSFKEHVQAIQKRYKNLDAKEGFQNEKEIEAYILFRTPATQAALKKVFSHLEGKTFKTALELGSGPGSSYPVLKDLFVEKIVYIEKEAGFRRELEDVTWIVRNFLEKFTYPKSELILFSYSLGELNSEEQIDVLNRAIESSEDTIVIVEPGTTHGYDTLMRARDFLIEKDFFIHAPCFHAKSCPKRGVGWCHFSVRLERSRVHRQIKGGSLGYEDEKYCFIIASKKRVENKFFTILDAPKVEKHRIRMNLCTPDGQKVFECKANNRELFKSLKKKGWGEMVSSGILSCVDDFKNDLV
jgi:ribosomal protein RSM22 (predicted rRNA methylase)